MKLKMAMVVGVSMVLCTLVRAGEGTTVTAVQSAPVAIMSQTNCPIMGGPINKSIYVDKDGTRIYVCCGGCVAPLKKDFDAIKAKYEKQGVTLAKAPAAAPK